MATAAQIVANQSNAQRSTGPVTAEGKARVSQNARKFGLFSVAAFIGPEERDIFTEFETGYMAELSPATPLEQTLAREIVHAAWHLRRCADLETNPPENLTDEEIDRLQTSIDRARSAAQRTFHRSLKELRRIQSEHLLAAALQVSHPEVAPTKQTRSDLAAPSPESAKQTQSPPPAAAAVPRNAACPCGSGNKYKRCCGASAQAATRAAVVRV